MMNYIQKTTENLIKEGFAIPDDALTEAAKIGVDKIIDCEDTAQQKLVFQVVRPSNVTGNTIGTSFPETKGNVANGGLRVEVHIELTEPDGSDKVFIYDCQLVVPNKKGSIFEIPLPPYPYKNRTATKDYSKGILELTLRNRVTGTAPTVDPKVDILLLLNKR